MSAFDAIEPPPLEVSWLAKADEAPKVTLTMMVAANRAPVFFVPGIDRQRPADDNRLPLQ